VKPTQLGPIDRASPKIGTLCFEKYTRRFLDKDKTMDNVQKHYICANGVLSGGSDTTIRHNTQIIHHGQTKHSTQNYAINKRHTTQNEVQFFTDTRKYFLSQWPDPRVYSGS
jgi:hypothetical protein